MRLALPVLLLLACASAPRKPEVSPAVAPAQLEARLRAALGSDVRALLAERVEIEISGDANVHRVITLASASPDELRFVSNLFPAALDPQRDALECAGWRCDITLDVRAEFPRTATYEFDDALRVRAIWLQVIRGP
jgi:hypothetical protein